MFKRFDIYKIMSSREKGISKRINDKTFTNSLRSKILKDSLSIKNDSSVIEHENTTYSCRICEADVEATSEA